MSLLEKYEAYNGSWLMQQNFPPTKYVVDGLIPEGLTYIIAAPKIGKSWMVLDLALAATQGTPFLGAIPVEQRPVLYLALEDGPKRIQARARGLKCYDLPESIMFAHRAESEDAIKLMREFMSLYERQEPLVILDTLGKIKPDKKPSAGAYEHDYRVSAALKEVADDFDGAVVVVHHNRKAGSEDFLEDVSGTQGIAGAADTIIVIRRPRTAAEGELHITSRDAAEGSYAVRFEKGKWTLAGASLAEAAQAFGQQAATKNLGGVMAEILDLVNSREEPTRPIDVVNALGHLLEGDDDTARAKRAGTYLARLYEMEKINRPKRGRYTRVESVESVEMGVKPQVTGLQQPLHPGVESVEMGSQTAGSDDIAQYLDSVGTALEDME